MPDARAVITEHLAAFNAHDTDRLLAGFDRDAVWVTGQDEFRGLPALRDLFDAGLWELTPSLTTVSLLIEGDRAAAELRERITVAGRVEEFSIALFAEVAGGLIRRAKVYREGSADLA
jgi:ketosteroid isomerase-like protein